MPIQLWTVNAVAKPKTASSHQGAKKAVILNPNVATSSLRRHMSNYGNNIITQGRETVTFTYLRFRLGFLHRCTPCIAERTLLAVVTVDWRRTNLRSNRRL